MHKSIYALIYAHEARVVPQSPTLTVVENVIHILSRLSIGTQITHHQILMATAPSASVEARLDIPEGTCVLTYEPLDVQSIIHSVADDGAGATAVFIGTTRNSFKGRGTTTTPKLDLRRESL